MQRSFVQVRQSAIPGVNGLGLFASHRYERGTALSLYPGFYYHPPPIASIADMSLDGPAGYQVTDLNILLKTAAENSSAYRITCEGGGFLDAAAATMDAPTNPFLHQPTSTIASAHRANHSSTGENVRPITFEWHNYIHFCAAGGAEEARAARQLSDETNKVNPEALWYVDAVLGRGIYYTPGCVRVKGMALVACRDIDEGEELCFDYKIRHSERPPWYPTKE